LDISRDIARTRVEAWINRPDPDWPDRPRVEVLDEHTIERPYGWVFFYHVPGEAIPGNAPILITRNDGRLWALDTAYPVEHYLACFEKNGDPRRD